MGVRAHAGLEADAACRAAIWLSSADLAPQRKEKPRKRRKKKSLRREPQHETDPKTEPCDRATPNTAATSLSRANHDHVGAVGEIAGDVETKRRMPADMAADVATVHPNFGQVVDGAELEQDVLPFPVVGKRKRAPIPDHWMKRRVADSAHLTFRAKRNEDLARQFLLTRKPLFAETGVLVVKLKLPLSVEVHPQLALELGF